MDDYSPHPVMKPRPKVLAQELGIWNGKAPDGVYCEQKHDGWRLIRFDGQCRTRQGVPFRGISHIERALDFLAEHFDEPMAFDGEFVVGEGRDTLAMTKAHQDSGWKAGDAGRLYLFDAIPLALWQEGQDPMQLCQRKTRMERAFQAMLDNPLSWEFGWSEGLECPLVLVESRWCDGPAEVEAMAREVWRRGGEGVVAKEWDAPYRRERNNTWRKLKR